MKHNRGLTGGSYCKDSAFNVIPDLPSGKIPWRRKWQLTPVFWPGKFQGQRSLAGYSPWGHKESDVTERLTISLSYYIILGMLLGHWSSCFLT